VRGGVGGGVAGKYGIECVSDAGMTRHKHVAKT